MKGIMFIEYLYGRTIDGYKTMTRRIGGLNLVNGAPATKTKPAIISNPDDWLFMGMMFHTKKLRIGSMFRNKTSGVTVQCWPLYETNSIAYLKEPVLKVKIRDAKVNLHDLNGKIQYKYQAHPSVVEALKGNWSNKMFMGVKDARSFIKITGIKVERLQDISNEDCIAEGVESYALYDDGDIFGYRDYLVNPDKVPLLIKFGCNSPRESFFSLFKSANKIKADKDTGNPWVWVYSFEYLPNYKP